MPSRRAALRLIAGSALGAALPTLAIAQPVPGSLRFRIMRVGKQIGTHTVGFQRTGGSLRVSTAIDIEVKIAFVSAFRFSHRGEERWEDERLVELKSSTNENGERFEVTGILGSDGLKVTAPNGTTVAPATAFTTNNLWNPMALRSKDLVDAHHGGIVGIVGRMDSEEEIVVGSKPIVAARYRIVSPFFAGSIWYDQGNRWRKSVFELKGEQVEYQAVT